MDFSALFSMPWQVGSMAPAQIAAPSQAAVNSALPNLQKPGLGQILGVFGHRLMAGSNQQQPSMQYQPVQAAPAMQPQSGLLSSLFAEPSQQQSQGGGLAAILQRLGALR